jgi:predicted nucleic acid-binding protein
MTGPVFVDSNVLVYARDRTDEEKHTRALEWMAALWESESGRLSYQVLHEYYVTVTAKLDPPREKSDAREDVVSLAAWQPLRVDLAVIDEAWDVQDRFGFSWWDALIVAAARLGGCAYLLTEDLQDGQALDGLTVISPFTHHPGDVLGQYSPADTEPTAGD